MFQDLRSFRNILFLFKQKFIMSMDDYLDWQGVDDDSVFWYAQWGGMLLRHVRNIRR